MYRLLHFVILIFIMVFGYFRQMLYISLLFTNAVAILSEDRFLAKSEHPAQISKLYDGWTDSGIRSTLEAQGRVYIHVV